MTKALVNGCRIALFDEYPSYLAVAVKMRSGAFGGAASLRCRCIANVAYIANVIYTADIAEVLSRPLTFTNVAHIIIRNTADFHNRNFQSMLLIGKPVQRGATMNMILLKNVDVYAPQHVGMTDILLANDKIIEIRPDIEYAITGMPVLDLQGRQVIPGLIDQHVHSIGGGGEDGYASRVPALKFSDCVKAGVTTLVGLLGTDSRTRSLADLLSMTKGLTATGITSYCLTGAYEYPSPTLTGSVGNDIVYIAEVLGVKLAISDHRCSNPTKEELVKLASEVRIAALLSKKPGVVHLHVGAAAEGIRKVLEIIRETPIPAKHFRPTHMGGHLDQALEFATCGGYVDITAGEETPAKVKELLDRECPSRLLTMSSDSNGSFPKWNERKEIIGMTYGRMTSLFNCVRALVNEQGMALEQALPFITENVARALDLYPRKGVLQEGADADMVVLGRGLSIESVMAKGRWLSLDGKILVKGMYED